jgi:hypothetical protein
MKNLSKIAALALVSAAAFSTQASAQVSISFGGGYGNHGYYHHNATYHQPVVYRHVAQAPVYYAPQPVVYVQPQTAYYARPVVQPVVSHRYVKRQQVSTYYEAVPRVRNQVVGYEYYGHNYNRYYSH